MYTIRQTAQWWEVGLTGHVFMYVMYFEHVNIQRNP